MAEKTSTATKAANEPAASGGHREAPPPAVLGLASTILGLQQATGNRTVGRLLGGAFLQPKLRIGPPGDAYEQEADRIADAVLREGTAPVSVSPVGAGVQRMCAECEEEMLQRKCHQCQQEEEELLQPKSNGGPAQSTPGFEARVDALKGAGRPLPANVRSFFEPRFGNDFGAVRVHTGSAAGEAAQAVRARAFTVGNDVVFGAGEWSPGTTAGKRLLAHELTHVVQQTPLVARRKPILQRAPQEATEAAPDTEAPAPEPAPEPTPSPSEPTPEASPAEQAPATAVVVEDDATEVGEGQMKKSEFLARLRPAVLAAAEAGLTEKSRAEQASSYIDLWLGQYETKDAEQLNSDLSRLVSGERRPTTAEGYISAIAETVRTAVATWERTGEVPPELALIGGELSGAGGLLGGLGGVFFKALPGGPRSPGSPQALRAQLGAGRPLDGGIRSRMESAFGRSFSHVQVHTDGRAAGLSHRLNARAFTVGSHVAFGPREYQPGTLVGDALIAHELAHVAQQGGATESVQPMRADTASYGALERDADMAAVGAVASLWGVRLPGLRLKRATPRLSSGLRLQRCGTCHGQQQTPATGSTPASPSPAPPAAPRCCDFDSYSVSGDTYADTATESRKKVKFTFAMKPGADEKKCVLVNWVKGYGKDANGYFQAPVYGKPVDINFSDFQIDSQDTDPVYWSLGGTRWRYKSEGASSYYATDNPGPALQGEEWDLNFKMCLHCIDDVSETSDVKGSDVKNPLQCINWDFKAKYDSSKKAFEH